MSTPEREEELRRFVRPEFQEQFDRQFYEDFGRFPEGSPLYGTRPQNTRRRQAVERLAEQGATEGERAAARAALARLDAEDEPDTRAAQDLQDEADYEDAVAHGAA